MEGRSSAPGMAGQQSPAGGTPVILLAEAASEVERVLVKRWLREADLRPSAVLPLDGGQLARALEEAAPDTIVTAARVAWLPPQIDGNRQGRWPGGLPLAAGRRPPLFWQARIVRREPDRVRVVQAEPATVAALRARWGGAERPQGTGRPKGAERPQGTGRPKGAERPQGTGRAPRTDSFAQFVARQARLALERAERPLRGYRYKVPREVVEAITDSAAFSQGTAGLATRLGKSEAEVMELAVAALDGLVASMSPVAVDLLSGALRPLHARAWEVQTQEAGLERLRELNRRHALVFLPSHRSYADPLLLADVLAGHDFPRNHVLGGENLSFWPIGPLAKRAGVVFIRRSFGGDEIYKLALREYLGYLLSKRFNLEWYMEGGRSRTGKLRPPRYGLLTYLAEAVEAGYAEDAYLVPVSITYDQLREVSAMAAEQGGVTKKAEGLSWLYSYARGQLDRIGTVQVRFAEPLSLRQSMVAGPPEGAAGPEPDERDAWRLRVQKVAFEVAVRINRVTPATATALVTLALLGVRDRALTLGQVRRVLEPLVAYLAERDLPHSGEALRTPEGVRRVLGALAQQHVVTIYAGGEEPVYAIERGQHLVAAFYRNSAIHHFIDRAVAELVLLSAPADRMDEAMRLRDQLKFEFFFPDKESYRGQLATELDRLDPGWQTADGRDVLARSPLLVAHRVLRSFVDAQLVVAERLAARDPGIPVEEKEFLDECGGVGQQMLLQGRLHGPESLSRELFASALKLAANLDLTGAGPEPVAASPPAELAPDFLARKDTPRAAAALTAARRREFAARLRDVVTRVIMIDEIDAMSRQEAVGVEP